MEQDFKESILYYDKKNVSNFAQNDYTKIYRFLNPITDYKVFHTYLRLGLMEHNAVYDRSGEIPHFLNMAEDLHPLPKHIEGYNKSFYEVAENRAKELLALNQPINVMWSGGLDSTFALFMLRKFANDKDQVRVYGTYNSIIESGDMFDRVIKDNFKYEISTATRNDLNLNSEGIYVSGMCGNQLFGPTDDMFGNNMLFHHTLGTPETIYESYEKNIDPELLEFLYPAIKVSPRKIETVADLRWYCIFNLDWYTAIYEHKILLPKEKAEKIYGFFDSIEFQEWAANTKEPFTKVQGDPNTHRWQMREILSDIFGEVEYAKNKEKKISNFSITEPGWIALLEDYRNVFID
jgi:hypothetical protein